MCVRESECLSLWEYVCVCVCLCLCVCVRVKEYLFLSRSRSLSMREREAVRRLIYLAGVSLSSYPDPSLKYRTRSSTCPSLDINSTAHSLISNITSPSFLMSRLSTHFPSIPSSPRHQTDPSRLTIIAAPP